MPLPPSDRRSIRRIWWRVSETCLFTDESLESVLSEDYAIPPDAMSPSVSMDSLEPNAELPLRGFDGSSVHSPPRGQKQPHRKRSHQRKGPAQMLLDQLEAYTLRNSPRKQETPTVQVETEKVRGTSLPTGHGKQRCPKRILEMSLEKCVPRPSFPR